MNIMDFAFNLFGFSDEKPTLEEQLNYFITIGKKERKKVIEWYLQQKGKTTKQQFFLNNIRRAIETINYEYKLPMIEPSLGKKRELYYQEGAEVADGMSCSEWNIAAREYAPQYKSEIATLEEVLLWYAYRIAMGYWNISYVCDDILKNGSSIKKIDPDMNWYIPTAGTKKIAGAKDGIGNTSKIVKAGDSFILLGASFEKRGLMNPVTSIRLISRPEEDKEQKFATPIIVLK